MTDWGIDERLVSDETLRARAVAEAETTLCSACGETMYWDDSGVTGCLCLGSATDRLRERAERKADR